MKNTVILTLLAATLLLTGCDMFRRIAGRPTSDDISAIRTAAANAEVEALKARQKAMEDSLAAQDSERQALVDLKKLGSITELYSDNPKDKYYIIVGSFRDTTYLENMIRMVASAGYIPATFKLGGSTVGVGVSPVSTYYEAVYALKAMKRESFCPSDAWILYNK